MPDVQSGRSARSGAGGDTVSIFDDTRAQRQHYRDEACYAIDVVEAAHSPNACEGCRHWRCHSPSAVLGSCLVSGSFRAPGGLFTEGDFYCCHWSQS